MKKICFILFSLLCCNQIFYSQCVPTCSNYAVTPITFTTLPTAGNNAIPLFLPNADDGCTQPVQIGFNFNFYCTTYSNVLVYSNGLIQFDIGAPSTFPFGYDAAQFIPNANTPTILNGIVAFKMDDLDPGVGGSVTYTTLGTSPNMRFVVTYSDVPIYGTSILTSGQIVLYQTSNVIDIYTISAPLGPNLATQGVENALGTLATAAPSRNQSFWSATASAYRFSPVTPGPPTSISGSTNICNGSVAVFSTSSNTSALSYSWSFPGNWNGSSTTTAVTATVGATGNVSVTANYTCGSSAATTIAVNVIPAPVVSVVSVNPPIVCSGNQFTITPAGGINYTLNPGGLTSNSAFVVTASTFTNYVLTGSDANCPSSNQALATILINPSPTITVNSGSVCLGTTFSIIPTASATVDGYAVSGGFLTVQPASAGIYTYQVIGLNSTTGCSSLPVISSLTVNAIPQLTLTAPKTIICKDESVVISASGASTYSWNNGSTSSSISVTPPLNTSNYSVTGASAAGCRNGKSISILVVLCTGIGESDQNDFRVAFYPNPTNGILNIDLAELTDAVKIELFDFKGDLILETLTEKTGSVIDLSVFPNGIYSVRVRNSFVNQTFKIIKD